MFLYTQSTDDVIVMPMVDMLDDNCLNMLLLTRAVYATATTAMTGIDTTIGSPVAEQKPKDKSRRLRKRIQNQLHTSHFRRES